MTIELKTTGGIVYMPGLAAPVVIRTEELTVTRRDQIEHLVAAAAFFTLPEDAPPSKGADNRTYIVAITDGARHHTVRRSDPIPEPPLAALIAALREEVSAQRAAKRTQK